MPPRQSIILVDTMAIKASHDLACWNALRKNYALHTVRKCIEEATRVNRNGHQLVRRTEAQLAAELVVTEVGPLLQAKVSLAVGERTDLDPGERDLLAYALSIGGKAWWLCGPDNGTVNALQILRLLGRMVSLEELAKGAGVHLRTAPFQYTERWLSERRLRFTMDDLG
jgi:hypothetical protein